MTTNQNRIIAFLFVAQTLFVASTFRAWIPVCTFAAVLLFLNYTRQRRLAAEPAPPANKQIPRWVRWSLMSLLYIGIIGVTAAWRLGQQLGDVINPIYAGVDIIAHASLFCSLVVWWRQPRGHVAMLALGLVVILLCVAAGGTSVTLAAQTTVALASCVGYALASQIILGGARSRKSSPAVEPTGEQRTAWLNAIFSLLTLSALMMATSAIANATSSVLPRIQESLQEQLQASLDAVTDESYIGGTRYVRGSRLGSIRRHMLGDPQEIALRVHAEYPPGYLRGHAFDRYRERRWSNFALNIRDPSAEAPFRDRALAPIGRGNTRLQSDDRDLDLNRFSLTETSDATIKIEVHNDPIKGPVVFLPLTTRWMEANSREILVTDHNVVRRGVDVTKPYVAAVGLWPLQETLTESQRSALLDVPSWLKPDLADVVKDVCDGESSAAGKANAVSQFFQGNFGYTLDGTGAPRGVDPIAHFLRVKHDAHCEYFATATVLMLRQSGVPARYVTGYVADELNDETEFWVARNRDAHAWAEAYDDQSQEWFPVESTPGRTYQTVDPRAQAEQSDGLFDVFGGDDSEDGESFLSRVTGWFLSIRATDPLMVLFRFAQLPLFLVLLFLLWSRYLRPAKTGRDAVDQQSRSYLKRADRRLKRHSLIRSPSETLYQFADRVESFSQDLTRPIRTEERKKVESLSRWYRDFANARYQGQTPSPFA
ncbi:MAG: transglutaminaseTgpA domain-containing protein [Rubripirellula sp.]